MYIQSIQLQNIQGHKNTLIEFNKGVNVIVGSSDSGKSTILRSLQTVFFNDISFGNLASFWVLTEKGNFKDECLIELVLDDGTKITRFKTKEKNGYAINGKEYTALGQKGIPTQVQKILNVDFVNFQRQMDSPFLIGDGSAEVARKLNVAGGIDKMDVWASCANSYKLGNSAILKSNRKRIEELEASLAKFEGLETAIDLNRRYEAVVELVDRKKAILESFLGYRKRLDIYKDIVQIELPTEQEVQVIDTLYKTIASEKEAITKNTGIKERLFRSFVQKENLEHVPTEKEVQGFESAFISLEEQKTQAKKQIKTRDYLQEMKRYLENIEVAIKGLEAKMPKICPLCEKPL